MIGSQNVYEVRPRKDKRGVDLISDALPFVRLWYGGLNAVSCVYLLTGIKASAPRSLAVICPPGTHACGDVERATSNSPVSRADRRHLSSATRIWLSDVFVMP